MHRSASMASSPVLTNGYRKSTSAVNTNGHYTNGHHVNSNGHHAHHHHPTSPLASNGKTTSSMSSQRSSMASRSSIGSHIQPGATTNGGSPPRTRGSPPGVSPNCSTDDSLVIIRLRPDSQGRFGFNVKVSENGFFLLLLLPLSFLALPSALNQDYHMSSSLAYFFRFEWLLQIAPA